MLCLLQRCLHFENAPENRTQNPGVQSGNYLLYHFWMVMFKGISVRYCGK